MAFTSRDVDLLIGDVDSTEVVFGFIEHMQPPEPIENLLSSKFRIIAYYEDTYNELDIKSMAVLDQEFRLNEDILDAVEYGTLNHIPQKKEVVLCRKDDCFKRAMILDDPINDKVKVYYLDAGGRMIANLADLRPVTRAIMRYPILAYHVLVHDMPDTSYLFIRAQYMTLMNIMMKEQFTVTLGAPTKKMKLFSPTSKVILEYEKDGMTTLLTDTVLGLKRWEWERFSSGCNMTDDNLCENGTFRSTRRFMYEDAAPHDYQLNVGDRFVGTVSRAVPDQDKPNAGALHLTLLDFPAYHNCFDVLHRQLQRYCINIRKSEFFPAIGELFLFKFIATAETEKTYERNIKMPNKWARAVRLDEIAYLLDVDDTVPFMNLPKETYEMRRLYGEFLRIPCMTIKVHPHVKGESLTLAHTKNVFFPGGRFTFQITGIRGDWTYEAEVRADGGLQTGVAGGESSGGEGAALAPPKLKS